MLKLIKDKSIEYFVITILLGGVIYSGTTAWQNKYRLNLLSQDVIKNKRAVTRVLLSKDKVKDSDINAILGLISLKKDSPFSAGVMDYRKGDYNSAYKAWNIAAAQGNRDAIYAIVESHNMLTEKSKSQHLTKKEEREISSALKISSTYLMNIKKKHGIYVWENSKNKNKQ